MFLPLLENIRRIASACLLFISIVCVSYYSNIESMIFSQTCHVEQHSCPLFRRYQSGELKKWGKGLIPYFCVRQRQFKLYSGISSLPNDLQRLVQISCFPLFLFIVWCDSYRNFSIACLRCVARIKLFEASEVSVLPTFTSSVKKERNIPRLCRHWIRHVSYAFLKLSSTVSTRYASRAEHLKFASGMNEYAKKYTEWFH